jgi:hypothetical protein
VANSVEQRSGTRQDNSVSPYLVTQLFNIFVEDVINCFGGFAVNGLHKGFD